MSLFYILSVKLQQIISDIDERLIVARRNITFDRRRIRDTIREVENGRCTRERGIATVNFVSNCIYESSNRIALLETAKINVKYDLDSIMEDYFNSFFEQEIIRVFGTNPNIAEPELIIIFGSDDSN